MKVTKGMKRLCVFLLMLLYCIGMTLACITWMIEDIENKALLVNKDIEVLVLEQEVLLLKDIIRNFPAEDIAVIPVTVKPDTRIDIPVTTYKVFKAFAEAKVPSLSVDDFYLMAERYGIDAGFALATFILETGWAKSDAWLKQNNPAGITCNGRYCTFGSKTEGVEEMFQLMSAYVKGTYAWIGTRRTVAAVRQKWSTTEDTKTIVAIWQQILSY